MNYRISKYYRSVEEGLILPTLRAISDFLSSDAAFLRAGSNSGMAGEVEVEWGDGKQTGRRGISTADVSPLGGKRFEVWAADGALTQPQQVHRKIGISMIGTGPALGFEICR